MEPLEIVEAGFVYRPVKKDWRVELRLQDDLGDEVTVRTRRQETKREAMRIAAGIAEALGAEFPKAVGPRDRKGKEGG